MDPLRKELLAYLGRGSAHVPLANAAEAVNLDRMPSKHLTSAEITEALLALPGWTFGHDALAKEFKFASFREAMSFLVRVSFEAEEMDHHPDWTNVYNRVSVRLNSHDAGGKVTAKDVTLARKIQGISWVG